MSKPLVAQNGASRTLNPAEAQLKLAEIINEIAPRLSSTYCWKLVGSEPNSLATFLDVSEGDLISILRMCKIYGPADTNVRLPKFENFVSLLDRDFIDWSSYRAPGSTKAVPFIKIGVNSNNDEAMSILKPRDEYTGGVLVALPVSQQHWLTMKPRAARKALGQLLSAVASLDAASEGNNDDSNNNKQDSSECYNDASPRDRLLAFVVNSIEKEVMTRLPQEDSTKYNVTQRLERHLKKNLDVLIKDAAAALLKGALGRLAEVVDDDSGKATSKAINLASPERVSSTGVVVTPTTTTARREDIGAARPALTTNEQQEDDEDEVMVLDDFLTELKEEVLLFNLITKRLVAEPKKRVLTMHHDNGRTMLVVMPPDTETVDRFVRRATATQWVEEMLPSVDRVQGILTYLARNKKPDFQQVANKERAADKKPALSTSQTVALSRILNLNGKQQQQMRSYMNRIGNVQLSYKQMDLAKIDSEVGVHAVEAPVFGVYTHEWALTKSKKHEKRLPEKCHYWNVDLSAQVCAEIDLHIQHKLTMNNSNANHSIEMVIDYMSPGFDSKGIAILFGGDHGDKSCPMSVKMNLASPQQRKEKGKLNYQ